MRRTVPLALVSLLACRPAATPEPDPKAASSESPATDRNAPVTTGGEPTPLAPTGPEPGATDGAEPEPDLDVGAAAAEFLGWLDARENPSLDDAEESVRRLDDLGAAATPEAFMVVYEHWLTWVGSFCIDLEFTEAEESWLYENKGKKPKRFERLDALPLSTFEAEGDWYYGPDFVAIEKRFGEFLPDHEQAWLALSNADPIEYGEDSILVADVKDLPAAIMLYEAFLARHPEHPKAVLARDTVQTHVCDLVAGVGASEQDYARTRKQFVKRYPESEFAAFVRGLVELEAKPGVRSREIKDYIESKSECSAYDWDE